MQIFTAQKNNFIISTDKEKLQQEIIHNYLSKESYWAKNIPMELIKKSIEGSFCFGMYDTEKQVGFARVVTDFATFGYLADVFVLETYRGQGLGKWMVAEILNCPALQGFRRWMLGTKDAHELYRQFGFTSLPEPDRIMQLKTFTEYPVQDQ